MLIKDQKGALFKFAGVKSLNFVKSLITMKGQFKNSDGFKIRVESLKNGHVEEIREEFDFDFIDVHEDKLIFEDPVFVAGTAYLADTDLILHLDIATLATIPCSICNEPVKVPVEQQGLYLSEPLDQIKTGVFSLVDPLREAILIETPAFAECCEGNCPKRKELEKYLKTETTEAEDPDGYHPFENLKLD